MAVGDALTGDYQIELRGIMMGNGSSNYIIGESAWEGFGDSNYRIDQWNRPLEDGAYSASELRSTREMSFPLVIQGSTTSNLQTNVTTMLETWAPANSDTQFAWQLANTQYTVWGRPRGIELDYKHHKFLRVYGVAHFVALDPHIYILALNTVTATLSSGGAARSYTKLYSYSYTSTSVASGNVQNAGTAVVFPKFVITGPCTGPKVMEVGSSNQFSFPQYTVGAGEELTVDGRTQEILLDDSVLDNSVLVSSYLADNSDWLSISGSTTKTYTYSVVGWTATTTCAIQWRNPD